MQITEGEFKAALEQAAAGGEMKLLSESYFMAQDTEKICVEAALFKSIEALAAAGRDTEIFENMKGVKMPKCAMMKAVECLADAGAALRLIAISRNNGIDEDVKKAAADSLAKSISALERKELVGYMVDLLAQDCLGKEIKDGIEKACLRAIDSLGEKGNLRKLKKVAYNRNSTYAIRERASNELAKRHERSGTIMGYLSQRIADDKAARFRLGKGAKKERFTLIS